MLSLSKQNKPSTVIEKKSPTGVPAESSQSVDVRVQEFKPLNLFVDYEANVTHTH